MAKLLRCHLNAVHVAPKQFGENHRGSRRQQHFFLWANIERFDLLQLGFDGCVKAGGRPFYVMHGSKPHLVGFWSKDTPPTRS
jgi:hypothetical protein